MDETALNRLLVNLLQHLVRAFPCAVRIAEGDAVGAEAGGDGRAFAFDQVFEVQVTHLRGGVHDGTGDPRFLGGGIQAGHGVAGFAVTPHVSISRTDPFTAFLRVAKESAEAGLLNVKLHK